MSALKRQKEETQAGLNWFLDSRETEKVNTLKGKMTSSYNEKNIYRYEARIYDIYLESICRQVNSPLKFIELIEKYIRMLERCETSREAQILGTVITDLLKAVSKQ